MNIIFVVCFILVVGAFGETPSFKISEVSDYQLVQTSGNSSLYQVNLVNNPYEWPIFLLDLHGSRFQMGYDYGYLWGARIQSMYWEFLLNLIGDTYEDEFIEEVLGPALDFQWMEYLSLEVPSEFLEEIAGMYVGGHDAGIEDVDKLVTRIVVLANAPGDLQDWIYVLLNEWNPPGSSVVASKQEPVEGLQCSMFGVWGSRTTDGSIYTARNLDWNKDTGIAKYKMITVYHPNDGKYAHATCGFAGLIGALAGMSSQGITVHEANLEEDEITFFGFPWVLRLRYIMENAKNIEEAQALWASTNNTVGFNHMVGSGADAQSMVFETMRAYTAYFLSDDPRESNATYSDGTGAPVQIGFPLKEALYRTNHGYDPKIRKHFEWSQSPSSWSMTRYKYMYHGFSYYEEAGIKITALEAINITSIVGDKGSSHAFQCLNNTDGGNVLSCTFHPAGNEMYIAWEDGTQNTWRPACCNTYVHFDMSQWWDKDSAIDKNSSR